MPEQAQHNFDFESWSTLANQDPEGFEAKRSRAIEEAIRICHGNVPKAAANLGVSASTLYRKRSSWEQAEGVLQES